LHHAQNSCSHFSIELESYATFSGVDFGFFPETDK